MSSTTATLELSYDDGKQPRLRLSRSDRGWIDVRVAAEGESGIMPEELATAIRWINSKN